MAVATAQRPATRRSAISKTTPAQLKRYFEAKLAAELGPHNVKRIIDEDPSQVMILDVRSRDGYRQGHIPGAINIPFEEFPQRLKELPKGKGIITYCWDVTCLLCTKAAYILASKGFRAREMLGGMQSWEEAGFRVER